MWQDWAGKIRVVVNIDAWKPTPTDDYSLSDFLVNHFVLGILHLCVEIDRTYSVFTDVTGS